MKNLTEIQQYLAPPLNLTAFAQEYRLPLRTLANIRNKTSQPTRGTLLVVNAAIKRHERKKEKKNGT